MELWYCRMIIVLTVSKNALIKGLFWWDIHILKIYILNVHAQGTKNTAGTLLSVFLAIQFVLPLRTKKTCLMPDYNRSVFPLQIHSSSVAGKHPGQGHSIMLDSTFGYKEIPLWLVRMYCSIPWKLRGQGESGRQHIISHLSFLSSLCFWCANRTSSGVHISF